MWQIFDCFLTSGGWNPKITFNIKTKIFFLGKFDQYKKELMRTKMPQLLSTRHRFLPSGHEDFLVLKITFSKSQGRPIHTIWLKRIPQGTYPDDTRKIPWWQPSNQKAAADISLKCISRAAPWTKYFLCWKCSSHSWPFHYPKCPSFDFSFSPMMPNGYHRKNENKRNLPVVYIGNRLRVEAFPKDVPLGSASGGHFFWERLVLLVLPYT